MPSLRYHPAADELPAAATQLPWPPAPWEQKLAAGVVGQLAKTMGAKSPGRLISSAKSWLSHAQVDRTAAILPWGADDSVAKISPLHASASYLAHIQSAWDHQFPQHPLAAQDVILTLPASFDESARQLTLQAAECAGLPQVFLLEEPQAACYDWLYRHSDQLAEILAKRRLLLVCDVGGGTTDLSLIRIEPGDFEPNLSRIAVGDHLMLGGDNMDLALAHLIESKLGAPKLSTIQFGQLISQCQQAKERLLANAELNEVTISLLASGARLIGQGRKAVLQRSELTKIVEGFLPLSELTDLPQSRRAALVEFGLPYTAEPAISKHLAAFLQRFAESSREALNTSESIPLPDTVLLNGGVFHSAALRQRLYDLFQYWGDNQSPLWLDNPAPDLAVARGAVAYGLARRGKGLKIGGGSARSYFLQLESGDSTPQAVCVLPRGATENQEVKLAQRFALKLGQPVRFHLLSATEGKRYRTGEVLELDRQRWQALPPLASVLDGGSQQATVQLAANLTEVGTLELACVAEQNPSQRWQLEFELRSNSDAPQAGERHSLHPRFTKATDLIDQYYGDRSSQVDPKAIKTLRPELEKLLGKRPSWDSALLRALADHLLEQSKRRRRSADHERLWFNLVGFTLRPGFGDPLDEWRIEQLWPLYTQSVQFANEAQNWSEWWTLWRRVAGGLDASAQAQIADDLNPHLQPLKTQSLKSLGKSKKQSQGYDDMVQCVAALEHLSPERKAHIGQCLLTRLNSKTESVQTWWAIGRIGSRVPLYGSAHQVLACNQAEQWLEILLRQNWHKIQPAALAATLLARKSGDRARDINDNLRQRVLKQLSSIKAPANWLTLVSEVCELDANDTRRFYGDSLPVGLKLLS